MKRGGWIVLAAGLIGGCKTGQDSKLSQMKFGPPPPGYVRIVGEPVPDWSPVQMTHPRASAGVISWFAMGPKPILGEAWSGNDDASGRVVSLAVDPRDGNVVYAASASGGLWKTTDGGATWTPKTDELSILNHGCVALAPSNPDIVYLGTGEYTTFSAGDGLFRSTDGGTTFVRIGTTADVGSQCSRIVIDPTNANIIHLTGRSGYVRSTDGGATWSKPLGSSACSDVVINPADPSIVFVARHSDGIYRSTDGGVSFSKLAGGLPSSNMSRILLAHSASNPDVLYTAIVNNSSGLRGLYRSGDGGSTWVLKPNTPNFPSPQGWYDCFIGVDPLDENRVFCGGVFPTYANAGVTTSADGGDSWTDVTFGDNGTQIHPDMHTVAFGPDGRVWVGCDGGIWASGDDGQTWINKNNRLTVTQNYQIAVHPTDTAQVMGGTQDNGTVARDLATDQWPQIVAGDGGFLAYDHFDPTRRYTTYVYLTTFRLDAFGTTSITGPWGDQGDPVNFIAPLVIDPSDARTLLGGTNRIWRTTNADAAATWTAISGTDVAGGGTINTIAVGPPAGAGPSNNIYSGGSTGRVYVTTDGANWIDRSAGLPSAGVSDIMVNPEDETEAYVSFFRSSGGRIFKTSDMGATWTDVTGSLPSGVTSRALAVDWDATGTPGLYVGSGAGVWVSVDGGATWLKDGADLPNVNIGDLYIDPVRREITAGTYGRGAWRALLPSGFCGNAVIDPGETCDTAIPNGQPGACPTDCPSGDPCVAGTISDPNTCQAMCTFDDVTDTISGDGCCPPIGNARNDGDCPVVCGNGICEPNETVTCPADCSCAVDADCNDNFACTIDQCTANTCTFSAGAYGDVDHSGVINVFDLFCLLNGLSGDFSVCNLSDVDLVPCSGDGAVNIFDLFGLLDAFSGIDPCCG